MENDINELISEIEKLRKEISIEKRLSGIKDSVINKLSKEVENKGNVRGAGRKPKITDHERELIKMYRYQGYKLREISETFKISIGAISKIINEERKIDNMGKAKLNEEWIRIIDSVDKAERRYVLEFEGLVYEADNEQDIMARLYTDYIESDERAVQLMFRIDLARALAMWSIMHDINVDVVNGAEEVKENYAAAEDDLDYEKEYKKADVIIDVYDELTMFKGMNEVGYAKIYFRDKDNTYKLF